MSNLFLENDYATYHWENGIVVLTFKKVTLTIEGSIKLVEDRLKFVNKSTYPVLVDNRLIIGVKKEALNYFDTTESKLYISAVAIFVESFISRFFSNIFLRLNVFKHTIPTRIFNSREDAINWLTQFK